MAKEVTGHKVEVEIVILLDGNAIKSPINLGCSQPQSETLIFSFLFFLSSFLFSKDSNHKVKNKGLINK